MANAVRAGEAYIELTSRDGKLIAGLRAAQARLESFSAACRTAGRELLTMATIAAAPLALAVREFAGFDAEMRKVGAIVRATAQDYDMLTAKAREVGRTTSYTATQAAGAMTALGRMGFSPQEIAAATSPVMALARATDTELAPAAEVVSETDSELQVLVSALPAAAAEEIGAALDAARVHVTHTDATALGWLRSLWPRLCEVEAQRRLVLLRFGEEWELAVVDGGAPVQLRGIGKVSSAAQLCREVTLSLLACDGVAQEIGDVAVCSMLPVDDEVLKRLAVFGPVRTVIADNALAGVEGCARRIIEGGTFDVTPADWVEARTESRFRRSMKIFLFAAVGLWALVMGVFFGYEAVYNHMRDSQKSLCKEKQHAREYKEVLDMTNRVALIDRYEDRSKCALEMLKLVSDSLSDDETMVIEYFKFRRGEDVSVRGKAPDRESWRQLDEALRAAPVPSPNGGDEDDEDRPLLFAEVKPTEGSQNRDGLFPFTVTAKFPVVEDDSAGGGK